MRVSQSAGREGESFRSPVIQADRIGGECDRLGIELLRVLDEVDVSGGLALEKRRGLYPAVQAIEAGEAEVLVVAYFDRLVRNIAVQQEVVDRVETAGGQVLTVDFGQVSHATATQWLTASQMGLVNDYVRRVARERSGEAQARAVARGVLPYANVPPGLRKRDDGTLEADPTTIAYVRKGFEMRANGATIREVRAFWQSRGIERSYHGVQHALGSRLYLGEIHFGVMENLHAHAPVIDLDLWKRVQRMSRPRGRRAKSDRLLARLGVLRCANCDARMIVGTQTQNGRSYPFYRCSPVGDCQQRVTISGAIVEGVVVNAVRAAIAHKEGRASAEQGVREAVTALERAQADLDAALRAFAGLEDEEGARARLVELRAARDAAQGRVDQLGGENAVVTLSGSADWERLNLDERRDLIRAVVERVTVGPGRGAGRITVELFGE